MMLKLRCKVTISPQHGEVSTNFVPELIKKMEEKKQKKSAEEKAGADKDAAPSTARGLLPPSTTRFLPWNITLAYGYTAVQSGLTYGTSPNTDSWSYAMKDIKDKERILLRCGTCQSDIAIMQNKSTRKHLALKTCPFCGSEIVMPHNLNIAIEVENAVGKTHKEVFDEFFDKVRDMANHGEQISRVIFRKK